MAGQSEPSLTLLPLIFDTEKAGNHESRHGGDLDLTLAIRKAVTTVAERERP